jgi:hypothetical protein
MLLSAVPAIASPGIGWGTAEQISAAALSSEAWDPDVASSADGSSIAVWVNQTEWFFTDYFDIYWSRYTPAGGWSSEGPLESSSVRMLRYGRRMSGAASKPS